MPLTHAQFVRATWPSAEVFAVCSSATHGQDAETREVTFCRDVFFGVSWVCKDFKTAHLLAHVANHRTSTGETAFKACKSGAKGALTSTLKGCVQPG